MLIDAIASLKSIPLSKSEALISKISKLAGPSAASLVQCNNSDLQPRTSNSKVFYIIDKINKAVVTRKDKLSSESYFVSPEEQLDLESDHYGYTKVTTVPSPTMHFQIDNVSTEGIIGNRSGLLLFFIDGELKPVWNGSYIGEISLEERDLIKEIIMKSEFKPGEEHNIRWCYFETRGVSEWPVSNWLSLHLAIREK